jgi:NAD(P)-dependent dehydrogenase (short-subunit alcohol dehydrogenase family)
MDHATAGRSVVVTGVSTGIGHGITSVLIRNGVHVFGSVRKQEDAARLTAEFRKGFTPLLFDVTDAQAIAAAVTVVRERLSGTTLLGLVNNAGISVFGPLMHVPLAEFRRQLEVNLVAVLAVTQAFIPLLGADRALKGGPGRIVNMGSVSGKIAAPFLGPYAASKFALEGLSESLRRELMLFGIDVIVIGPGAVATPIWEKAEQAGMSQFDGTEYAGPLRKFGELFLKQGKEGFPPERVGATVWRALSAARPRVRYAVVPHALTGWVIPRLLPKRLIDRIIGRSVGLSG